MLLGFGKAIIIIILNFFLSILVLTDALKGEISQERDWLCLYHRVGTTERIDFFIGTINKAGFLLALQ